jgi:hypothetical protein
MAWIKPSSLKNLLEDFYGLDQAFFIEESA